MDANELNRLRAEIDALDEKLVDLFNQRARCVLAIGHFKQEQRMAVYEPKREAVVLANVARCNEGPLPDEELATIYTAILASMRRLQSTDILERS
ncbi:MAG: chorismate mutase [Acidobacteriota bacterium]|nr:chorismate mutase [Acidobacteriota bacterium]